MDQSVCQCLRRHHHHRSSPLHSLSLDSSSTHDCSQLQLLPLRNREMMQSVDPSEYALSSIIILSNLKSTESCL